MTVPGWTQYGQQAVGMDVLACCTDLSLDLNCAGVVAAEGAACSSPMSTSLDMSAAHAMVLVC